MNFYQTQKELCEKFRDLLDDARVSVEVLSTYVDEGDIEGMQEYVNHKHADDSLLELFRFLNNELELLEPSTEIGEMLKEVC